MRTYASAPLLLLALVVVLPFAACQPATDESTRDDLTTGTEVDLSTDVSGPTAEADDMAAMAMLENPDGEILGEVRFIRQGDGLQVVADVEGIDGSGPHGFHVHENGVCDPPTFESAGGHFNPTGTEHACPPTTPRHAGDLGNMEIGADGTGHLELTSELIALDGETSVIGKAVILHGHVDDCTSQPTGDAGARLACGVIALSQPTAVDRIDVAADGQTPPAP